MARMFPSRRRVIGAIAACGASGFAGRAMRSAAAMDFGEAAHVRAILHALFSDLRRVAVVGRACLPALPTDAASLRDLARLIPAHSPGNAGVLASAAHVRHSIRQRIRRDFADGDIVVVDRWILAATEVRLYALAALLSFE